MLNTILETCAGTLTQGLIYAILSYGIFITYKILDFPDLTVDGSFPLGAAVTAVLLTRGVNAWLTLPVSLFIGAAAGLCTGLIHVRAKVRDLLAGIITMTALYSINLQIAGSNLTVERAVDTIYTSAPVMAVLGGVPLLYRKLLVSLVLVVLIGLVLERCGAELPWRCPLWAQALACGLAITAAELCAGIVLNLWLGLGVWDYSHLPGNLWGQVCPQFAALWCVVSGPAIVLLDWIRYAVRGGERPHYIWICPMGRKGRKTWRKRYK